VNRFSELEKILVKKDIPAFKAGDTIKVYVKIKEGDKTRLQAFEGICIAKKGSGLRESFTLRRISYGEGVERIFQSQSPLIDAIEVIKRGNVRRAKLYYLRKKVGKETKVKEKREFGQKQDAPVGEKGVS